jgi:acid phosphatase family membrane protein YuiD
MLIYSKLPWALIVIVIVLIVLYDPVGVYENSGYEREALSGRTENCNGSRHQ